MIFPSELDLTESPKTFRILMVLDQSFPPDIRVENEATSLVKAGFEVTLLVLAPDIRQSTEKYKGFTIIRKHVPQKLCNWMRGLSGAFPILSWFITCQIQKLHKHYSFDVIHAHDLYMCGGALKAGERVGIPVVADLHEVWVSVLTQYTWSTRFPGKLFINIRRWKTLEKIWASKATKVVVITEDMATRYIQLGCSTKDVCVLPNTVNIETFDNYPVKDVIIQTHQSEFTLVYAGTINPHRGLGFLLDVIPLVLSHCSVRLVIVGDGRIRPELEAQAKSLGILDHVIFEGWKPQAEIKSYILSSDACLLPLLKCEHTDTIVPHKLFHYMYLKRSLITTDCTYIKHIVETTECGLVVPYGDHKAMASSIIELYNHPERRKQMGANGHRAVLERYNWGHSVQSLIQMYRSMAEESRRETGSG
ncbi:MAG: glycosyltransferase family 4 protein [Bacteroidetes bacterium]|nr:glycosyltransferase family 4 protein [Bacteroidota bacterium]MCY4205024.1 glycosyltransferase family 4 protein [Bacteroidota bacterium]